MLSRTQAVSKHAVLRSLTWYPEQVLSMVKDTVCFHPHLVSSPLKGQDASADGILRCEARQMVAVYMCVGYTW